VELSQTLLTEFGSIRGLLYADLSQLRKIKYLGLAKTCSIKAVGELSKRSLSLEELNRLKLDQPERAYNLIRPYIVGKKVECLYLISLDINHKLLKINLITLGTSNQSLVDIREILRCALLNDAISIIMVHNHPSNNTEPSPEDISITKRLAEACFKAGLVLLDHIIAVENSFYSFKASGLLNFPVERG